MCSRASGLFCACLLVSCVFHCGHCTSHQDNHNHSGQHHYDADDESIAEGKPSSKFFIRQLFNKFGQDGVLSFTNFEKMLESLGIKPMISSSIQEKLLHHNHHHVELLHNKELHEVNSQNNNYVNMSKKGDTVNSISVESSSIVLYREQDNSSTGIKKKSDSSDLVNVTTENPDDDHHDEIPGPEAFGDRCMTAAKILHAHGLDSKAEFITEEELYQMCPAILYQIVQSGCLEHSSLNVPKYPEHHAPTYQVWLYATLSVIVISLCGLICVAVIPLIQKSFYQSLLQFFVGLAIGSLSGDALLHLLPHAMILSDEHEHGTSGDLENHRETLLIWRGLTALLCIYLFFIAERLLNLITSYRRMKHSSKAIQVPKCTRALKRVDGEQSRVVGEKLSHHKHDSYGYKFDPAAMEALERLNDTVLEVKEPPTVCGKVTVLTTAIQKDPLATNVEESAATAEEYDEQQSEWEKSSIKCIEQNGNPSSPMKPLHVDVTYLPSDKHSDPETPTEECHRETVVFRHAHDQGYIVTVTDHHHHGHSHEVPSSVSSVAWMVVLGDGLHNFCDGMAIGAAFGAGVSSGLSTAIAVMCHELPHELGDFAMLLKAGMPVKQALLYNSLSSGLCFLGMIIGVSLGGLASATGWIFSGAAGMFLYIALVDMLPELMSINGHPSASNFKQFGLQLGGIMMGTSIMLLIALYEHNLQTLFS